MPKKKRVIDTIDVPQCKGCEHRKSFEGYNWCELFFKGANTKVVCPRDERKTNETNNL